MARTTNAPASRERRKRVVDAARGYRGRRSKLFRYAKDARYKAMYWSYRDRKARKRTFRSLWITRISAACRANGISYSRFAEALSKASIQVDRKILADLAMNEPTAFAAIFGSLNLQAVKA
jgi:large subunit ribosomal protein L20